MPRILSSRDQDAIREHLELGMVGVVVEADVCGAGFLVDPTHVITCAHTVNEALGRDRHDEAQPPDDLELIFPFADRQRTVQANVVAWRPVGDGHNDIAVLRLKERPPSDARPVRIVPADLVAGHRFVAWGFPLENAGEMYAEGIIQRRRGDDRIQVIGTEVPGQAVRRGFSGTAVWDEALGGVIGMVAAADPNPVSKTAYLVPTDVLAETWPPLDIERPRPMIPAPRVVGERVSTAVDMFRDRIEFRARLRGLILSREHRIICVTGRRGIGKSGLVARVLADFEEPADATDDSVGALAYLSTRTGVGVLDLARVFHALASLLPQDQRDRLEDRWANVGIDALPDLLTALRTFNTVLVLDNLDDLQDPDTGRLTSQDLDAFLTAVCRTPQPPLVVTTSQRPIGLPAEIRGFVKRLEIDDGLELDDAVELLRHLDADGEAGLRDLPDPQLRQAVEHVHGMPRGLELLVALLAERQTATLQRIFDAQDTPEVLLGRLVSEGFKSLDTVGRDVLRLFALADTLLPVDALPRMLDGSHPPSTVIQTVERLVNRRMLGFERATGRGRLHPIDSDYVRRTLLDDPEQRAVLDLRLADWLATQRSEASTWRTSTDVAAQRREIRHRVRAGDEHGAIRVIAGVAGFLAGRGETDELTTALAQVRDAADIPETRAAYELSRGVVELWTGSLEEAVAAFRAGRDAAEQAGNRFTIGQLDMYLGNTLRYMGEPAAAREPLARASALPPTDQASRAVALESLFLLGLVECYLDETPSAAEVAARCEAMLRPDDPSYWRAWLSDLRALVALVTGDHAAALAEVERGIARYADSPQQPSIGYLLNVRGLVLLAQGRIKEAARVFQTMREDAALVRQARLEGFAALNLAWTRLLDDDPANAAMLAREAADRLTANRASEAPSAVELAAACEASGINARLALLHKAVRASHGNPDLYQPSEEMLARLARVGDDADSGPARRRQRT